MDSKNILNFNISKIIIPFVFICFLIITLFVYKTLLTNENLVIKSNLKSDIVEFSKVLNDEKNDAIFSLIQLHSFDASSKFIERNEFKVFAADIIRKNSIIQELAWLPLVTNNDRYEFEQKERENGFSDFQITDLDSKGQLIKAKDAEKYFPIYYVEPFEKLKKYLGLNFYSNNECRKLMNKAISTGLLSTVMSINLFDGNKEDSNIVLFMPVYKKNTSLESSEDRIKNIKGFMQATFCIETLMKNVLNKSDFNNINFIIYDDTVKKQSNIVIGVLHKEKNKPTFIYKYKKHEKLGEFQVERKLRMADRSWIIIFTPTPEYLSSQKTNVPLASLVVGIIFSIIMSSYLSLLIKQKEKIEKVVSERTRELESLNNNLENINYELQMKEDELLNQNEELIKAKERSEEANRAKSIFLGNMSHELRTPLNSVIGLSDMLNKQLFGNLNEKQMEYVELINDSGKYLLNLINDILDITKLEAGAMEVKREKLNIDEQINHCLNLMEEQFNEKQIDVYYQNELLFSELSLDKRKFKQVLLNLLSNALKFTDKKGEIRVTTKQEELNIKFVVADNGIGIKEDDLDKVFQEFVQLEQNIHVESLKGTGIGLALSKRIVELQGGNIGVESEFGEGTKFWFTLPLCQKD